MATKYLQQYISRQRQISTNQQPATTNDMQQTTDYLLVRQRFIYSRNIISFCTSWVPSPSDDPQVSMGYL